MIRAITKTLCREHKNRINHISLRFDGRMDKEDNREFDFSCRADAESFVHLVNKTFGIRVASFKEYDYHSQRS